MIQVVADMRASLGEPELPFLVGDYEAAALGEYIPTNPAPTIVIEQLRRVVGEVTRSALIPTEAIPMQDDHHFDLLGHRIWADRALAIVKEKGWPALGPARASPQVDGSSSWQVRETQRPGRAQRAPAVGWQGLPVGRSGSQVRCRLPGRPTQLAPARQWTIPPEPSTRSPQG